MDVLFSVNFFMKVLPVQANAGFCSSFAAQRTSIPWKGSAGTGCFEVFSSMHSQVSKCLKLPYEWTFLLYVCCTHVQPLPVRLLWLLAAVEAGSCRAICLLHPFHFLWSQLFSVAFIAQTLPHISFGAGASLARWMHWVSWHLANGNDQGWPFSRHMSIALGQSWHSVRNWSWQTWDP